ncbi:MAG: ferric reductase-like transmembrane domain-containing protein [Phycisphaerales bacterium]|nr:ferric reductase-like transmembrane domain-containing protein [Phycisphaerales bacterium]
MSIEYRAISWSRPKRVYDAIVAVGVVLFLGAYIGVTSVTHTGDEAISPPILLMRATGACAFVLLHIILCIGPLARLDVRFLPVLFNRRHLGVLTFLVALLHALAAIGFYHGFSFVNPLLSLLTMNTDVGSLRGFPFEWLGLGALAIMFLLAATSHDFWNKNLGARAWKSLHMLAYPAYALLVGHVALGALQDERGPIATIAAFCGLLLVGGLHVAAGVRETKRDSGQSLDAGGEWIDVGSPMDIPVDRARTVCAPGGERIAVFRSGDAISAVTNVCAHQGGPLGEGAIIDGCVTCPWHGWQYRAEDGCSPPPFQEKIATYEVRINGGRVQVRTRANAPGTRVEPARIEGGRTPNTHEGDA